MAVELAAESARSKYLDAILESPSYNKEWRMKVKKNLWSEETHKTSEMQSDTYTVILSRVLIFLHQRIQLIDNRLQVKLTGLWLSAVVRTVLINAQVAMQIHSFGLFTIFHCNEMLINVC